MGIKNNSDSLTTMLLNKIEGGSLPDYTIISSNNRPPLYDLAKEYQEKYPKQPVHSKVFISEITDPTASNDKSCPKLWIEVKVVAQLITDIVLQRLLDDSVIIKYYDGKGSYYDPLNMIISIKGAQDFIHEIGHHIWNSWLIRDDEPEKRSAVNKSLTDEAKSRKHLPEHLIPDAHKEYAGLIGAFSGQFIENLRSTKLSNRKNDLEEHFARNCDYLMRGRPLDVTQRSKVSVRDLLDFYIKYGLSDKSHVSFYMHLLKIGYGGENLNIINPENAKDGVVITRDELFLYHKHRIIFETGRHLTAAEQVALSLDLSAEFIRFCLARGAMKEIRDALKQKGITLLK
ncbi:hypothetical protein ACFL7M_18125, partial [Thermodesulfobacteriota bacterium]